MTNRFHDDGADRGFQRHEHHELLPWLDRVHEVGCAVGDRPVGEMTVALRRVLTWLERDHEAHLAWEEAWLYQEMDERAGTPWATRTLRHGHDQIRAAVRRLSADQEQLHHELTPTAANELRSRIFGLEAILRAHLECEDRVLQPLLEEAVPVSTAAPAGSASASPTRTG